MRTAYFLRYLRRRAPIAFNEGAKFVGHANVAKEPGDHPNATDPLPDLTFKDRYTFKLGGRTLSLNTMVRTTLLAWRSWVCRKRRSCSSRIL